MFIKCKFLPVLSILFLLLAGEKIAAQPFSLDERVQPIELILVDFKKEDTMLRGRMNISEVTQFNDTDYYFVKGLSMYSPVYFSLTANEGAGKIRVDLCKENWHQANQNGETDSEGQWNTTFKTEGDFGIMVIPENKPSGYTLMVWVGDEAKDVGITSPFKDADDKSSDNKLNDGKKGNFLKDNLLFIIIGLLVVIIGLLFINLKKKKI